MMTRARMAVRMIVGGSDRLPTVTLAAPFGAAAAATADGELPVPGGCLEALVLEGARLRHAPESVRQCLLRRARRLLQPGGTLTVPVGPGADQYPRAALEAAAWSCGFEAFVRYVAGAAVLTAPVRAAASTPLVSILIPAYKDAHFAAALDSALAQTWPRVEIVVADDSPGRAIAAIVEAARPRLRPGHELRYIHNGGGIGGRANYLQLFAEARGAYVKYLNDDDLLAPHCVEAMASALMHHPQATLVTSYRQLVDGEGRPLPDRAFNQPVVAHDAVIDGRALATFALSRMTNFIGEPTTVMFRKADAQDNRPHLMSYAGRSARRNGDMSIWTMLLSRGDAVWFAEPLSFFRQHALQVQHSDEFLREARLAWVELVADARETGLITPMLGELRPSPQATVADVDALVDAAEAAYAAGERGDAASLLARATAADPRHSRARGDLACLAWEDGRHDEAALGAMLALACPDPDPLAARNLADMLEALGRHDEASAVAAAFAGGA